MRKLFILLSAALLLASCELASPAPGGDRSIHFISTALDYEGTSVNTLEGTLADQQAMRMQLMHLAASEGLDFWSTSITGQDGEYFVRREDWDAGRGVKNIDSRPIGRDSVKSTLLAEIAASSTSVAEDDLFIFYYAGHGADSTEEGKTSLNGALVLGDIDFPAFGDWREQPGNLRNLLGVGELKEAISAVKGRKLVILDSCYSGSILPDDSHSRSGEVLEAIRGLFSQPDRGTGGFYFLCAAREDELSYEDGAQGRTHGKFSAALLEALGYVFMADGVEGVGLPSRPLVTFSSLCEAVKGAELEQWQHPVASQNLVDLVLFDLSGR